MLPEPGTISGRSEPGPAGVPAMLPEPGTIAGRSEPGPVGASGHDSGTRNHPGSAGDAQNLRPQSAAPATRRCSRRAGKAKSSLSISPATNSPQPIELESGF